MNMAVQLIKCLLVLTWVVIKVAATLLYIAFSIGSASESGKSRYRRYTKGQAYERLCEGKITTAEFIDCTKD
jgi:hypothetical protein